MNALVVCDWNRNLENEDNNFTGRTQDNNIYMHFAINGENSLLRPGGFIIADELIVESISSVPTERGATM